MKPQAPKKITVRPGEGRSVMIGSRTYTTENTPKEGVRVAWSVYLQRRLDCGDLVEVTEPAAAGNVPAAQAAPAATSAPAPGPAQTIAKAPAPGAALALDTSKGAAP